MRTFLYNFVIAYNKFIVIYVVIWASFQLLHVIGSLIIVYSNRRREQLFSADDFNQSQDVIPISIVAPAYNEGVVIVESVKGMLNVNYPVYEVVVVNDGSTDDSMEKLIKAFNLHKVNRPVHIKVPCATIRGIYRSPDHPRLTVVDKENGGKKADACNAGINVSRYPYFINMDSDCLLDQDALTWVARTFMNNKHCVAASGIMRISNGTTIQDNKVKEFGMPKKFLPAFQVVEYRRAFLLGRLFNAKFGYLLVISGAFGAFHKDSVISVGGYSLDSTGEDMDLVMKLHLYMRKHKYKYQISFSPKAICWTQAPETVKELGGQRRRWHIGLIQVMFRFREMILNPKFGLVGMIAMPYEFVYEMVSPILELLGFIIIPLAVYLEIISPYSVLLFCTAAFALCLLVSITSSAVDIAVFELKISARDFCIMLLLSVLEMVLFRPITLFFRLQAIFGYKKFMHRWDPIQRRSFESTSE